MTTPEQLDQHFGAAMQAILENPFGGPPRPELLRTFLTAIGARFDDYKLVDRGDPNLGELRGRLNGLPIRIEVGGVMGLSVEIEAKIKTDKWKGLLMDLRFDPTQIPTKRDDDDPFAEEDDIRAFLAKGLFLQSSYPEEIERGLAFWGGLTEPLRARVVEVCSGYAVWQLMVSGDGFRVRFLELEHFLVSGRPLSLMVEVCDLLSRWAPEVLISPAVEQGVSEFTLPFALVSCDYCGSKFALDRTAKCPNCGGGYQG